MKPYEHALREYGIEEVAGTGSNPKVLEYYAGSGNSWAKDDSIPWCAAFVGWALHKASKPATGLLNARSYLKYGTGTKDPVPGDIAVFWRDDVNGPNGHVAFFIARRGGSVYVLGGNQHDSVNVSAYPESRLLDYRIIP